MDPLSTFADPSPAPDMTTARGRIAWQDSQLYPLVEQAVVHANDRIDAQEATLAAAYSPAVMDAGRQVAANGAALAALAQRIKQELRGAVEGNGAALRALLIDLEALGPDWVIEEDGPQLIAPIPPQPSGSVVIVVNVQPPGIRPYPPSPGAAPPPPAPQAAPQPARAQPPAQQGQRQPASRQVPGASPGNVGPSRTPGVAPAPPPPLAPSGPRSGASAMPPPPLGNAGGGKAPGGTFPPPVPAQLPVPAGARDPATVPPGRPPVAAPSPTTGGRPAVAPALRQDATAGTPGPAVDGEREDAPEATGEATVAAPGGIEVAGETDERAEAPALPDDPLIAAPGAKDFAAKDVIASCAWLPLGADFWRLLDDLIKAFRDKHDKVVSTARTLLAGANFYKAAFSLQSFKSLGVNVGRGFLDTAADPGRLSDWTHGSLNPLLWRDAELRAKVGHLQVYRAWLTTLGGLAADQGMGPGSSGSFAIAVAEQSRIVNLLISYLCPTGVPTGPEATSLYLSGLISEDRHTILSALNNVPADVAKGSRWAARARMDASGEIRDWMRFRDTHVALNERLRSLGWTEQEERDRAIRSQEHIPGPADLVNFAIKDVYLPTKAGRADMVAEYKEQVGLKELFAAQGIGPFKIVDASGKERTYDSGEDYWLAHYHNAAPGQAFEMLHRLRPERVARFRQPDGKGGFITPAPVTLQTVRDLLKEDDLNPVWRDRLASISYHRLSIRDLRRIYAAEGFGAPRGPNGFQFQKAGPPVPIGPAEVELVASYQDAGYVETDARTLAAAAARNWDDADLKQARGKTIKAACELFYLGAIIRTTAIVTLEGTGLSPRAAESELKSCEMAHRLGDLKAGLRVAKKLYLRGEISQDGLRSMLGRLGVGADRVGQHITRWTIELAGLSKEATAGQMCGWYQAGLITLSEISARLTRLGYSREDAGRIVRHCEIGTLAKAGKERAKLAKAQARERERVARIQGQTRDKAARARAATLAKRLAKRTDSQLVKWWRLKLIDKATVRQTLLTRGVLPADADRWVTANLVPKAKK